MVFQILEENSPDLTVISFELLKVVEETNLDLAVKINQKKILKSKKMKLNKMKIL